MKVPPVRPECEDQAGLHSMGYYISKYTWLDCTASEREGLATLLGQVIWEVSNLYGAKAKAFREENSCTYETWNQHLKEWGLPEATEMGYLKERMPHLHDFFQSIVSE